MQDVTFDSLDSFPCPHCGTELAGTIPEAFSLTSCPQCGGEVVVPAKFGPFLLLERKSDSLTSSVFHAYDPKLGRHVTLKILNYLLSKNPELVEAFKKEALAVAALNSRYVLKVYEFGVHNRQPFMVMEHIEGRYLNEWMGGENITTEQMVEWTIGIVQGLEDMHERGILHGDVMPRNILIHSDGTPRISDFGLARFAGESPRHWENWSSPYYMPPERIRGEEEDFRGDFYSLGTTLYSLLTDQLPFFDLDEEVVLQRKLTEEAPDPRDINPDIPAGLAELTLRLLRRNPDERPVDYESLHAELSALRRPFRRGTITPPPEDSVRMAKTPNRKPGREPLGWFVVLMLLAILLAMLLSLLLRPPPPTPPRPVDDPTPVPASIKNPTPLPDLPTPTPSPPPTPTPLPLLPTAIPAPFHPASLPGLRVRLIPPAPEPAQENRIALWRNTTDDEILFRQPEPDLQPRAERLGPNGPPVLRLRNSRMISSLQPQQWPAFTLVLVAGPSAETTPGTLPLLIGSDPQAAGSTFFRIAVDPRLGNSLRFETERGSARLGPGRAAGPTAWVVGFRRGPGGEEAMVGGNLIPLASSAAKPLSQPDRLPSLQIGDLEGAADPFDGWLGEIYLFDRALSDGELTRLRQYLEAQYGIGE